MQASAEEIEHGTECLQLVHKYCGIRAKLLPGPDCLWKVTQKKDLHSADACLRGKICKTSQYEKDSLLIKYFTFELVGFEL